MTKKTVTKKPEAGPPMMQNTCWRCGHVWRDLAGQHGEHFGEGCPRCRNLYWTSIPVPAFFIG